MNNTEKANAKIRRGQTKNSYARIQDMFIIEVKNLTKIYTVSQKPPGVVASLKSFFHRQYKHIKAVDNISFAIDEGELVGFIGPNGAGKTTTLKVLSGLLYPTSGEVSVSDFTPWERKTNFQKQIAFIAGQKNQLWWDLPPYETFLLNKEIYEVKDSDFKARITYLSKMLDIPNLLTTPVKKLSLGQRMKAELVAALIHQPRTLFLDEPTIGLDIIAQKNLHDFIKDYNTKFNTTIILTSHHMDDVEKLAKRVIILNKGKIVYDGKLAQIVSRFTKHKVVSLDFGKEVKREKLKEYGRILSSDLLNAKIEIDKEKIADATARLLKELPITDLSIEEPPIEEIIRLIFTKE